MGGGGGGWSPPPLAWPGLIVREPTTCRLAMDPSGRATVTWTLTATGFLPELSGASTLPAKTLLAVLVNVLIAPAGTPRLASVRTVTVLTFTPVTRTLMLAEALESTRRGVRLMRPMVTPEACA